MNHPQRWESEGHLESASHDTGWSGRVQWGAILAGSAAGFGVVILMGLLGTALGVTAGTAAGYAADSATSADTVGKAAAGFGIGAAIWMILTAVATGLVGGWVLNSTSRRDRAYSSFIFGGLTWAVGVCAFMMVAAPGVGGALAGLGSGAGGAAAAVAQHPDVQQRSVLPGQRFGNEGDRNRQVPLTEDEKAAAADAAKKTATAATVATWTTLFSLLIALAGTIFSAGYHRNYRVRPMTELRPRPIPAP